MSDSNAHFGKTGLHCAKFTKLLRDPPFNIKEVSNGGFFFGANSLIVKMCG
jgi:hypothetical protein